MIKKLIKKDKPFCVLMYYTNYAGMTTRTFELMYLTNGQNVSTRLSPKDYQYLKTLEKVVDCKDGKVWEFNNFKQELTRNELF